MKKYLLIILIAVIAFIGYMSYKFYLSPSDNLRSIYLVPKDAVYIIEVNKAITSWKELSGSNVWKHMQQQPYFAELTSSANSLDSMIQNNGQLFDILGSRSITVSAHVYTPRKYDFLFIVDLEKASKLNFIQGYFTNLGGEGYNITKRNHKDHQIYEIYDKKDRTTLYLTFIKNLLVCSYINQLVESSINQQGEPFIGRDIHFIEMKQEVEDEGLFNVYLQYAWLDDLMRCYLAEEDENINALSKSIYYTGLNVNLKDEDRIVMEGLTNINDSVSSYLKAMLLSGKGKLNAQEVIPQRTAFYMSLAVEDFTKFYENFKTILKETPAEYEEYEKNVNKIEKFLKISLQDNFISWIGNEVAFVQTQPKGLGKQNELAVVIQSKNKEEAASNLEFIAKQIRKKTPVKFKGVDYKGYVINYLSVKGMFRAILGNFFAKLDKPYFIMIEDYVIFSNHPQTLKNIIDDYQAEKTLAEAEEYNDFLDQFDVSSNVFIYVQPPVLHANLKGYVSPETWVDVNKNKEYIVCFPQVGFQMNEKNNMFETRFISAYNNPVPEEKVETPAPKDTAASETKEIPEEEAADEIYLDDLDVKKYEEKYEDGSLKMEVDIRNGIRDGNYTEYYPNGKTKVKGRYREDKKDGTFKYYDEQGNITEKINFTNGIAE